MKMLKLSLASTIAAIVSAPAVAQAPSGSGAYSLQEIVTTARKREESIQDVPVSVTALGAVELAEKNIVQLSELVEVTPNAYFRNASNNPTSVRLTIRGQTVSDVLMTLDPAVGIYIDEMYIARPDGGVTDLLDVERAEILRGPQGTLFGRNTTGGAFNITTKRPEHNIVEGHAKGRFGNYGRRDYEGVLNIPLVEDILSMRLAASAMNHDGYGKGVVLGKNLATEDNQHYVAKLLWTPTEDFEVFLKADRVDLDMRTWANTMAFFASNSAATATQNYIAAQSGGTDSALNYLGGDPDVTFQDVDPVNNAEATSYSGIATWDLSSDLSAKFVAGYRELERTNIGDFDTTPYQLHQTATGQVDYESYSTELQLLGTALDDRLDWVAGVMWFSEEGNDNSRSVIRGNVAGASLFDGDVENESLGVFTQGTYRLTEQWSLTGGLRYSDDTKELLSRNRLANGTCRVTAVAPNPGICEAPFSRTDESVDYLLSVDYKPTEDVMLFARTTTGYKSGGHQLRGSTPASFQSVEPEEVTDYEVGFKADLFASRARLNGSVFYSEYDNAHRTAVVFLGGTSSSILTNAAEGELKGAELELTLLPIDNLTLAASLGIVDTKYKEYQDFSPDGSIVDRSDEKFLAVPEMTYSLSATYTLNLDVGNLVSTLFYNWRDEVLTGSFASSGRSDLLTAPELGQLKARVALQIAAPDVELAIYGNNLTDEREMVSGLDLSTTTGVIMHQYNRPREYGLELTYRFAN